MSKPKTMTYAGAGVDIDAGNRAVGLMKNAVQSTFRAGVLTGIGGFGGLFQLDAARYREPVLVSGTDGVGTKLQVAFMEDKHDTIGIDAVAMCVNDILTLGAEPLFFLDYLAVGKLEPVKVAAIVEGVAAGCKQAGCALIGGETAEMPGFYADNEYDIAGFAVGVVEKNNIIDGSTIVPGDILIGLTSSGLHSNGYSLARRVLLDRADDQKQTIEEQLGCTIGEELIKPTRIYVPTVLPLLPEFNIKGIVHITGGGLLENIPRILPPGTTAEIKTDTWPQPPVFNLIAQLGPVAADEMYRVFNMGVGLVLVAEPRQKQAILDKLQQLGETPYVIGQVVAGENNVRLKI